MKIVPTNYLLPALAKESLRTALGSKTPWVSFKLKKCHSITLAIISAINRIRRSVFVNVGFATVVVLSSGTHFPAQANGLTQHTGKMLDSGIVGYSQSQQILHSPLKLSADGTSYYRSIVTSRGNPDNTDFDGDGVLDYTDIDDDNDGIPDVWEGTLDRDNDGRPDCLDRDSDNDGLSDLAEAIASASLRNSIDADGDGAVDTNVILGANGLANAVEAVVDTLQLNYQLVNADRDTVADMADLDSDNDGLFDILEANGVDQDQDGRVDAFFDADFDGMNDASALNPVLLVDTDGDGIADWRDLDSDQDGLSDLLEIGGLSADINNDGLSDNFFDGDADGVHDARSLSPLSFVDTDFDGIPNHRDLDSDGDGSYDLVEAGGIDSDDNGVIDSFMRPVTPNQEPDPNSNPDPAPDSGNPPPDNNGGEDDIPTLVTGLNGNAHGCSLSGDKTSSFDLTFLLMLLAAMTYFGKKQIRANKLMAVTHFVSTPKIRQMKSLRLCFVASTAVLLSGCVNSFSAQPYAGLSVGASTLELDTGDTSLELSNSSSTAVTLTGGASLNNRFSIEGQFSDLGAAELNNSDEVGYQTLSVTGIAKVLPNRNGVNLFAKLGAGFLRNSPPSGSSISIETRNATHLVTGLGAEYNFSGGLSLRAEVMGHDADARHFDLGVMYRFGGRRTESYRDPIGPLAEAPLDNSGRDNSVPGNSVDIAPAPPTTATSPAPRSRVLVMPQIMDPTIPRVTARQDGSAQLPQINSQPQASQTQASQPQASQPQASRQRPAVPSVQVSKKPLDSSTAVQIERPIARPTPRPVQRKQPAVTAQPIPRKPATATRPTPSQSARLPNRQNESTAAVPLTTQVVKPKQPVPGADSDRSNRLNSTNDGLPAVETAGGAERLKETESSKAAAGTKKDQSSADVNQDLKDADNDGVADANDACARTPAGVPVRKNGCLLYEGLLSNVGFGAGNDVLSNGSEQALTRVARDMIKHPKLGLQIQVKAVGKSSSATLLARKRTLSVVRYLTEGGVIGTRLKPIAPLISRENASEEATLADKGQVLVRSLVKR